MKLPETVPEYHSPWFWAIPLFTLLSLLLLWLTGSNRAVFLFLNDLLYFKPEAIWINITLYGDAAMVMILLLPLIKKRPDIVVKTVIAAFITTLFIHAFKEFMSIPRPPSVFPGSQIHQLGNQFSHSSFPSGHAAAAFTLASIIIFLVKNTRIRLLLLTYASVIAVSRIATGVHWPIDIIAGALFGWIAAYISVYLLYNLSGKNLILIQLSTLLLLLAVIHLVFLHDAGDEEARFLEVLTPITCFILGLGGLKSVFIDPVFTKFTDKAD